jgi:transposase
MLQAERNRQEVLGWKPEVASEVPGSLRRLTRAIEEELERIEEAIKALLARHAHLLAKARLLESVPGIGTKTVLPILVFLERFHNLTRGEGSAKAVAAYAGLDPQPHESGKSVRGPATISRMGDRQIRRRMVMAALGGVRGKGALGAFYSRLVGRNKPKLLALVAAARKIVVWAWAVYRHGRPFSADYSKNPQPINP